MCIDATSQNPTVSILLSLWSRGCSTVSTESMFFLLPSQYPGELTQENYLDMTRKLPTKHPMAPDTACASRYLRLLYLSYNSSMPREKTRPVRILSSRMSPSAHLEAEDKVATDALLGDDVLHGAEGGAQVGVEKLGWQQTHRGGHQVIWQGHVCDLTTETGIHMFKFKNTTYMLYIIHVIYIQYNSIFFRCLH